MTLLKSLIKVTQSDYDDNSDSMLYLLTEEQVLPNGWVLLEMTAMEPLNKIMTFEKEKNIVLDAEDYSLLKENKELELDEYNSYTVLSA